MVNLQRLLQIKGLRAVYQMPDRLLRDEGIYNTLKTNGQLGKTLLIQIGRFTKGGENSGVASDDSDAELINIEDIPFIGAGINFDRILNHKKNDINVVWIRLGQLT